MLTSRKFQLSLVLMGLFLNYVTSAAVFSEEQVTEASDTTSQQLWNITTTMAPFRLQIPLRTCYVQESKVTHLMDQMSAVLRMLNSDQDYADSKLLKLKEISKLQEYEMCSEERIQKLTEEVGWVSRRLWELSIRLEEPKDAEVQLLDKRKVDLIRHLHNVVVFTGGSSTPDLAMKLESFDVKVEYLDYGFNTALVMFQTERKLRPNPSPGRFAKNAIIRWSILEPSKSTAELIEISREQPDAMFEALPKLVTSWYDRNLKNSPIILDFTERLPNLVHRMIGYAALYDAMSANSDLESYELTELVLQLKVINASVTSAAADIPRSVLTRYTQLVNDVWPVFQIVGTIAKCNFESLKYERSICGEKDIVNLFPAANSRYLWDFVPVPGTAMFSTPSFQWYSSATDVFSTSKRRVRYRRSEYVSELFGQWKLVPMNGGKHFKILNAMHDEVLFADKTEMNPASGYSYYRRLFLARHDYSDPQDYEQNADLWIVDCK